MWKGLTAVDDDSADEYETVCEGLIDGLTARTLLSFPHTTPP